MKIGFIWIYHWQFLTELKGGLQNLCLENDIDISELSCNGSLPFCYTSERNNRLKIISCAACRWRQKKSSKTKKIYKLNQSSSIVEDVPLEFAFSSLNTLTNCDDPDILNNPIIDKNISRRIKKTLNKAFSSINKYLDYEKPDVVCLLNGRMDVLRLAMHLLKKRKIPYFCFERSFLNYGTALFPKTNCLDFRYLNKIASLRKKIKLSKSREDYVRNMIFARTKGSLPGEFFNFNKREFSLEKKYDLKYKIVFLLSSEVEIFYDCNSKWKSFSDAFASFINFFGNEKVCLRGHPNWASNKQGTNSNKKNYQNSIIHDDYYQALCNENEVEYIPSHSNISSLQLAKESACVVIQNSTIYFELAMLNKPIIALREVYFGSAETVIKVDSKKELESKRNLINELINANYDQYDSEKTLLEAINIFHAYAFDMPVLHNNICKTTNNIREQAFNELFKNEEREFKEFYNLLIKN